MGKIFQKLPFASIGNLRCWIASGLMARSFCSVIALAMTSLEERHCEGNDKYIDGDIKPEAIQRYISISTQK